jgi:phospholipase/lecithinase/hemolysin
MHRIARLSIAFVFTALVAAAPLAAADDRDGPRLFVFGDSLSDSGNNPAPSPPYFEGRWSNGYTWADRLAPRFGLGDTLVPSSVPGGTNYARAGARVIGTDGVVDQMSAYLQDAKGKADKHATYMVFVGGNDIRDALIGTLTVPGFNPVALIDRRLATLGLALSGLSARGARHIVVLGLPDLSHLPGLPPPAAPLASFLSQRFNTGLTEIVAILDRGEHEATLIDVASLFDSILADAAAGGGRFGITNTTATCLTFVSGTPIQCPDPDTYLFWDPIHPTGRVHDLLADFVVDAMARRHD